MLHAVTTDKNNYEGSEPVSWIKNVKSNFFIVVPTPLVFDKLQFKLEWTSTVWKISSSTTLPGDNKCSSFCCSAVNQNQLTDNFFFFNKSLFNLVESPHLIHHGTTQMQEQRRYE